VSDHEYTYYRDGAGIPSRTETDTSEKVQIIRDAVREAEAKVAQLRVAVKRMENR
jgi:hypothetical protein